MLFAKSKFPKLAALAEKGTDATAEEIAAVNAELSEAGLNAVVLIASSQAVLIGSSADQVYALQGDLSTAQAEVTRLTQELATANQSLTTATESIATLTTERDSFKALSEKYGAQPGAMGSQPVKEGGDKVNSTADTNQETIDNLPHNQALAGNPLFNPRGTSR